jgi:integrase
MEDLRYFIKRPSKTRKTFALVCYRQDSGTKVYEAISETLQTQVAEINQRLSQELITEAQAEILLKALIQTQYRKYKVRDLVLKNVVLSEVNSKLFSQFWKDVYEERTLVDEDSARYDFMKAIRLIEPLSLLTATASDLKGKLKKAQTNEYRRAVDRLNQILTYLKRDFKLSKPEAEYSQIKYITKAELDKISRYLGEYKDLAITLFVTGIRISESMALKPGDLREGTLVVDKQFTRFKKLKRPKRGKQGKVFVVPFGIESVKRWCAIENKDNFREGLRGALATSCRSAGLDKVISPHDLRHSHAVYLLSMGASITQIALNLRNRVEVCQKHYAGFSHVDETIEALKQTISK